MRRLHEIGWSMFAVGLVACGGSPPKPATAARGAGSAAEHEHAAAETPRARRTTDGAADWTALPTPEVTESMQVIQSRVSKSLATLHNAWLTKLPDDPGAQRRAVASAIGPAIGLLHATWGPLRKSRPELEDFQRGVDERARALALPVVPIDVALGWLLVEAITADLVAHKDEKWPRRTLALLRFVTSSEDLYQAAFDILGPSWVRSEDGSGRSSPWALQSKAVSSLWSTWADAPAEPAIDKVDGVEAYVQGRPGVTALASFGAGDAGGSFGGNGRLEASEIVMLELKLERSGRVGTLISESLQPASVPDCMAVIDEEVELPEVREAELATVRIPVLVSGRCSARETLKLAVKSSHGDATAIDVTLSPRPDSLVRAELRRDADLPGSSEEHDASGGLLMGRALELLPAVSGPASATAAYVRMQLAWSADAALVNFRAPKFETTHLERDLFVADDDADLVSVPEKAFAAARSGRDKTSAFAAHPETLWLRLGATYDFAGGPTVTLVTSEKARGASRGTVKPIKPATAPTQTLGRTALWLRERLPSGVDSEKVLSDAVDAGDATVAPVLQLFGEAAWVAPSAEAASGALVTLLEADAISSAEARTLLEHFEISAEAASKLIASIVSKAKRPTATASLLVAHVDAKANESRSGVPADATSDDLSRGAATRVALSSNPAQSLAKALSASLSPRQVTLDTPSRKLARALIVAAAVVKSGKLSHPRRELAQLDVLKLDPLADYEKIRRIAQTAALLDALRLEALPDSVTGDALANLVDAKRTAKAGAAPPGAPAAAYQVVRYLPLPVSNKAAPPKSFGF